MYRGRGRNASKAWDNLIVYVRMREQEGEGGTSPTLPWPVPVNVRLTVVCLDA